jgi:hypothetical protein
MHLNTICIDNIIFNSIYAHIDGTYYKSIYL